MMSGQSQSHRESFSKPYVSKASSKLKGANKQALSCPPCRPAYRTPIFLLQDFAHHFHALLPDTSSITPQSMGSFLQQASLTPDGYQVGHTMVRAGPLMWRVSCCHVNCHVRAGMCTLVHVCKCSVMVSHPSCSPAVTSVAPGAGSRPTATLHWVPGYDGWMDGWDSIQAACVTYTCNIYM